MKLTWIAVANSAHARLLARSSAHEGPSPLIVLEHLEARLDDRDRAPGRAGHGSSDFGPGITFDRRTDAKEKQRERFAREIAGTLDRGIASRRCDGVMLFAPAPLLGAIRRHLGPAAAVCVRCGAAVDWTGCSLSELDRRIALRLRAESDVPRFPAGDRT